ncbi:Bestrophin-2 [Microtus ochrogaster]|uniref:Bestrophin-2 n=1 Tax=Microtus ochrogaster TaxID=79684 RepID=A0A8J6G0H6_MICOH|nr:Bestrophin-2 [Microtus ochrogaster]
MQFQRLDGVDGPLGEAHGDFLQRLLPLGAGSMGPLGRRLSLLRRKNSCVSEASTAASCGCAGAADSSGVECGCGEPLLDPSLREPDLEPPACPEPPAPIPGPTAEPFTTVPIPGPRAPAPPWLPSPIGEEEESPA